MSLRCGLTEKKGQGEAFSPRRAIMFLGKGRGQGSHRECSLVSVGILCTQKQAARRPSSNSGETTPHPTHPHHHLRRSHRKSPPRQHVELCVCVTVNTRSCTPNPPTPSPPFPFPPNVFSCNDHNAPWRPNRRFGYRLAQPDSRPRPPLLFLRALRANVRGIIPTKTSWYRENQRSASILHTPQLVKVEEKKAPNQPRPPV